MYHQKHNINKETTMDFFESINALSDPILGDKPKPSETMKTPAPYWVDGDTINKNGIKYRLAGFDTAEIEKMILEGDGLKEFMHKQGTAGGTASVKIMSELANKMGYTNLVPILDAKGIDMTIWKSFYAVSSSIIYAATASTVTTGESVTGLVTLNFELGSSKAVATANLGVGVTGNTALCDVYYYTNTTDALNRGDFEDRDIAEMPNSGTNLEIPELEVQLEQEALVAKTRKLKVKWSPEFAQDLNAYHSIDAEAELTSMLSEYITMEIDLEILAMLHNAASGSGFTSDFTAQTPSGGELFGDAFATLGIKMQAMSNAIHQSTMRGGANFAVMSPAIATYVESIAGFTSNTDGQEGNFAMGVQAIGTMRNRWTIYKNPYWTGKEILMGYRGNQFLETGAVFAPYIPLIMTPLVYDPTNFTPRKGVMTRYAKKVVRNDFYGVISVVDTNWSQLGALPS